MKNRTNIKYQFKFEKFEKIDKIKNIFIKLLFFLTISC